MGRLNPFSGLDSGVVQRAAEQYGTPFYLYDEQTIADKCGALTSMPNAYGLTVRYAMKANSTKAILKAVKSRGLAIDASSVNEARRALIAGYGCADIILTTQEAPRGDDMRDLRDMMKRGLIYNVCSLLQLRNIGEFAAQNGIALALRVHPGVGTGESASRNTGDKYSCFGIHLDDVGGAMAYAGGVGAVIKHVHTHIGSGGDPEIWRKNIDLVLNIIGDSFPDAAIAGFGGGLREARMPDESAADTDDLGLYAKKAVEAFYKKTGRKLVTEIEPGTYVMANAGYIVTTVADKKKTGDDGFEFLVLDGGMELNARPLLYGSRHPFYVVSRGGELLSSEFDGAERGYQAVPVGRCCESGDAQSLDASGLSVPRGMAEPEAGDYFVIGGAGAYCSAMAPMNYNSHFQAPEILYTCDGRLELIRSRQTLEQIIINEI